MHTGDMRLMVPCGIAYVLVSRQDEPTVSDPHRKLNLNFDSLEVQA